MNTRTIGYWVTTGLTTAAFAAGGVVDLIGGKEMTEGMAHLGYPAYLATVLGAWKVLGAIAIAAPRFPRLKEWAYAGIAFDLTGAAISHATSGDGPSKIATPLALLALAAASYILRPKSRVLGELGVAKDADRKPELRVVSSAA